jgi:GGDEF domain-containing protein
MNDLHPEIEATIEQLRQVVWRTVRKEQLVDRLTKLGNDDALNEWIESQIRAGDFWLAFVEVDRFKSINDEFSYQNADQLLLRIAHPLHCPNCGKVVARPGSRDPSPSQADSALNG